MRTLLACLIALMPAVASAADWDGLVRLPAGVQPTDGTLIVRDYDEATFLAGTTATPRRGAFVTGYLTRLPEGFHEPAAAAWAKWEPVLKADGWALQGRTDEAFSLKKVVAGADWWLQVSLSEFQDPRLTLVKVGAQPRRLALVTPKPTSETVSDDGEWPFVTAVPGSTLSGTGSEELPLDVTSGADKEPHLVGSGYRIKRYAPPATFSKLEVEATYADAFTRAGWTVLPPREGERGEGVVRAHITVASRDLWVVVGRANDDSDSGFTISVADLGREDWDAALVPGCHLPLYGVMFDFDKATLKPESTPVLQKAADALAAKPAMNVEVQGHTDDVGADAYNLRLSGQRADSVRAWLAAHGVAAARLTSKGYGKTQPVVENSSDANRARNRRVELRCGA